MILQERPGRPHPCMFVLTKEKCLFRETGYSDYAIIPVMETRAKMRDVILSFKLGNAPSLETLAGTLDYLRSGADWNVCLFTLPAKLSAAVVRNAEKEGGDGSGTRRRSDLAWRSTTARSSRRRFQPRSPALLGVHSDQYFWRRGSATSGIKPVSGTGGRPSPLRMSFSSSHANAARLLHVYS